jgi:hypothetical protein
MATELDKAEVNHLRRLLGWVRCESGQSPDEMVAMLRDLAPSIGTPSMKAQHRLADAYNKSANVPKYIRAAVKSLERVLRERCGEIVDAEMQMEPKALLDRTEKP